MGLNPPTQNKPGLAAWRRGFWDQRRGRRRYLYRGRGKWMQRSYQQGWYEAEHNPGTYLEVCFTDEDLVIQALRFALQHARKTIVHEDHGRLAAMEVIEAGWGRVLDNLIAKQKGKNK